MIHIPSHEDICKLTYSICAYENIPVTSEEIRKTWKKEIVNPYADSIFQSLMIALYHCQQSIDFPAKEINLITNTEKSHQALAWLRKINYCTINPLLDNPIVLDEYLPSRLNLTNYRFSPTNAVIGQAPHSSLIPNLMHNWLIKYATFHHSVKDRINNPYGLSSTEAKTLYQMINDIVPFFACVKPFGYGNLRIGRITELAFKWKWNVPVSFYIPGTEEYKKLVKSLETYEKDILPSLIKNASS